MRTGTTIVTLFAFLLVAPAWAADDVDAVAAELEQAGDLVADDAEMFEQQLRTRLGDSNVCAAEGQADCQQRLRQQIRAAHRLGKQNGRIENASDAAAVASAVMLMAGKDGGDVEPAGELVVAQLKHQWKAEQIGDAAQQMRQLQHRWRHQTMKMVGACVGEGSCMPEEARTAVSAMKAASQRADLDPRRAARTVRSAVAEHARERGDSGDSGDQLQKRLRKRLHLDGEGGTENTVAEGEQHRHQYRRQMDGEGRRGGKWGGNASSGAGCGSGSKPRGGRN